LKFPALYLRGLASSSLQKIRNLQRELRKSG
jgi:hypothetical protein